MEIFSIHFHTVYILGCISTKEDMYSLTVSEDLPKIYILHCAFWSGHKVQMIEEFQIEGSTL